MAQSIIKFKLPMVIVDTGIYQVTLGGKTATIKIKLVQNKENFKNISDMEVESSGGGGLKIIPDPHGVANYSDVEITIPFNSINEIPLKLEQLCVDYINRLVEVVRYHCKSFWLSKIGERDILTFSQVNQDDSKNIQIFGMGVRGRGFPIAVKEQTEMINKINETLIKETPIPFDEATYLDAINYYVNGDFNEAVIMMNLTLEVLVARHLYSKLIDNGKSYDDAYKEVSSYFNKGLHKVMDKIFLKIDNRSLTTNIDLWKKFDEARTTRKNALHPHIKRIGEKEAYNTMMKIIEVIQWVINPTQKKA